MYSVNDLLLLLGQCTVELAWLRKRVAELEAQVTVPAPNGHVVEVAEHA